MIVYSIDIGTRNLGMAVWVEGRGFFTHTYDPFLVASRLGAIKTRKKANHYLASEIAAVVRVFLEEEIQISDASMVLVEKQPPRCMYKSHESYRIMEGCILTYLGTKGIPYLSVRMDVEKRKLGIQVFKDRLKNKEESLRLMSRFFEGLGQRDIKTHDEADCIIYILSYLKQHKLLEEEGWLDVNGKKVKYSYLLVINRASLTNAPNAEKREGLVSGKTKSISSAQRNSTDADAGSDTTNAKEKRK